MTSFRLKIIRGGWDPDKHPRDREGQFARIAGHGTPKPPNAPASTRAVANYTSYQEHTAQIARLADKAISDGLQTDKMFTVGGDGETYYPERAAQHKEIVDELYKSFANVPNEGKMVIAGGLGGAGKSTVLQKFAGIDQSKYATINPDDIKEVMAKKGMVPKVEGLSPMEAATLIHEESGLIANMLAKRLYGERKNIVWDITMSRRKSVEARLDEMKQAGYTEFRAVFVDIPVETSVERAMARHRRGWEAYRRGEGFGGRYVPPEIIRANASASSSSANREVFDVLRGRFDQWEVWDNSHFGVDPKKLDSSRNKETEAR